MRISVVSGGYTHFFIRDLCDLIDYYADMGYTALDLSLDSSYEAALYGDDWKMPAKRIKTKMAQRGMIFGQAHAPAIAYIDAANEKFDNNVIQCIRLCGYFGIPSLVAHLFHIKGCTPESFVEENVKYFSRFLPYLDECGVDICFENLGGFKEKDMYCFDADDLLKVINAFSHPRVHACWDTGHANLKRLDQYENVVKLGDHLRAVHIHDNLYPISEPDGYFTPDGHNFPLFGNVNFDAFIQGLIDIDYKGTFSTETDTPNRRGHIDFFYNGELTLNLKPIPFRIRKMADEMLFEICKYMMQTYGLWEEK